MLANSPQVQGMTPWILKDFRAMLRTLPGIQDYRNRKGLIDENGERKAAFYVLRDSIGTIGVDLRAPDLASGLDLASSRIGCRSNYANIKDRHNRLLNRTTSVI